MSVEAIPGGKRRIDRVLDPRFVAGVEGLELEELRARRRRRVERLISDETIARLPEIEVEELPRAVEALMREEGAVSANRRAVQHVVDLLRGELARRYRNGTASVAQLLE